VTASGQSKTHATPLYMSEAGKRLVDEFPDLYSQACEVSCPPGWYSLVRALSALVVSRAPEVRVAQVKPKCGLRWSADYCDSAIKALITEAEQLSWVTCEGCGKAGKARGWRVLCDGCEVSK
jgi:hypothetical protein